MTSSRPYLVRAMYQWIVDNGMTPHLLVNAEFEGCAVPAGHINDGKIVLNVAPMAVQGLTLGDDEVSFSARFGGKAESILVPVPAILAVYARENGQGMMFSDDDQADGSSGSGSDDGPETDPDKPRPNLRVVK
jgi:stringent starvation protein B